VSYLLHFSGPSSFEQTVALKPGGEAVVVGRDTEAAVYLPDTDRLVSRRHLSIEWAEGGAKVMVLSANGINTDQGDYFSGDTVVLADGESARIGSFSMIVSAVQASADLDATSFAGMGTRPIPAGPDTRAAPPVKGAGETDPWAQLLSEWSPGAKGAAAPAPAAEEAAAPMNFELDDPFSSSTSWRLADAPTSPDPFTISGTLQPDPLAALASAQSGHSTAGAGGAPTPEKFALQSLCRGLGVEPPQVLTSFDWERFGTAVRHVVQCLADHLASRGETRQTLKVEDRTMLGAKEVNPLKSEMPIKELVQYLLFMPEGAAGFVPANRALQEAAQEASAHEAATRAAARGLAEGALKEFEPTRLRAQLLKGKLSIASVVDNARLWELYASHYEKQDERPGAWAEQLFNRHYMAAYLRETERLRRAAQPKPPERTS
jgi:type VI secretion system FHA domain protein